MGRLTAIVLGAAAGGGFPQWNCRCAICRLGWERDPRVKASTQASLAVSADGQHWTLLNAAPDLRAQVEAVAALHPRVTPRDSPIAAVVLTGAEVDQVGGLLCLRERQPFALYGTRETLGTIEANPIFEVLAPDVVTRHVIGACEPFGLPGGLQAELFAVPGKAPLYLEGAAPQIGVESGATVGAEFRAGHKRLIVVPGAAAVTAALKARFADADVLLFDGTLFTDDEMIRTGTGTKTGRRMGHMMIDGPDGSLAALSGLAARRLFIHINNTNPIRVAGSDERHKVEAAGWEIAEDGMEIVL
jgi:pyrroloquinoline quinone biosynthesis protein B